MQGMLLPELVKMNSLRTAFFHCHSINYYKYLDAEACDIVQGQIRKKYLFLLIFFPPKLVLNLYPDNPAFEYDSFLPITL